MADALMTLGIYGVRAPADVIEPARAAASRALALAPKFAGALACLGCIEALHDQAWDKAVRDFHRAIDLSPDDGSLRQWYATNALVPLGRFDEALRELRLASALDPLSLAISASIGIALYYARRFEEAEQALADTCQLEPRFGLARLFLGYVYAAQGRFDEAVRELETASQAGGTNAGEHIGARLYAGAPRASRPGSGPSRRTGRALDDDAMSRQYWSRRSMPGWAIHLQALRRARTRRRDSRARPRLDSIAAHIRFVAERAAISGAASGGPA